MSIFTKNELEYISEQRLGRLATVDRDGNPHVVPVGFRHNPEADTIDIGGEGFARGLDPQIIRLQPVKIIAWGIDEKKQSRKVNALRVEANANQIHVIV